MEDGQVFLWALVIAIVSHILFTYMGNLPVRIFFLVTGVGALFTALIFWNGVSGTFAIGVAAVAVIAAGIQMLMKKKGKERQKGEVQVGLVLLVIGVFSFLTIIGALSDSEGTLGRLNDAFTTGGEVFKELWNRTDQGIEEINR